METVCPSQLTLSYPLKIGTIFEILPMYSSLKYLHNIYFISVVRKFKISREIESPYSAPFPNLALCLGYGYYTGFSISVVGALIQSRLK